MPPAAPAVAAQLPGRRWLARGGVLPRSGDGHQLPHCFIPATPGVPPQGDATTYRSRPLGAQR